ncbi:MAG: alpha/beta fold hydrolase [Prevotella sp.]|nr:alpha/beta fold hydrolase [Prevotella sp.]
MKHLLLVMAACVASVTALAGRVITDSVRSQVLGATVKYNIYLPNGFAQSGKSYPVVYLLHGFTDDYTAWRDKGQMQTVADELIESGEICEMIIVMPNAGGPRTMETWNGYFNMPGWNYEDFFFQEFMPQVEQKYRGIGDKGHRAVMGLSMGGGGSTVYAQRHPNLFSSCYCMSGWLESDGGKQRVEGVDDKVYLVSQAVKKHSALAFVENADAATVERLRTVKWFFDCGDDDFLFDLSVKLHQLMREKRIKDELRIRNGVHNWEYWHQAIRIALPFASRNFSK